MKTFIPILLLFVSITSFSQRSDEYNKFIEEIKKDSKADKNDKTVLILLNDIYDQGLQSDQGELQPEIDQKIQKLYSDKNAKNLQLLNMFLAYQEHLGHADATGGQPDANFQMNLITVLESE